MRWNFLFACKRQYFEPPVEQFVHDICDFDKNPFPCVLIGLGVELFQNGIHDFFAFLKHADYSFWSLFDEAEILIEF